MWQTISWQGEENPSESTTCCSYLYTYYSADGGDLFVLFSLVPFFIVTEADRLHIHIQHTHGGGSDVPSSGSVN